MSVPSLKVMIVDDSIVYRSQLKMALEGNPRIEITGNASNGKIALQKLEQIPVDLMVLDLEMPVMDGLAVLKAIQQKSIDVKVIIYSSLSPSGVQKSLDALNHGAEDFVTKVTDASSVEEATENIRRNLVPKILQFCPDVKPTTGHTSPVTQPIAGDTDYIKRDISLLTPQIVVIASSTGGPQALEKFFSKLTHPLNAPILIAQHIPNAFVGPLCERIAKICNIPCKPAEDGAVAQPGTIHMCPGDFHLRVSLTDDKSVQMNLHQGPKRNSVRPAADELFESAADIFGTQVVGFVLTGMGADGQEGSQYIKERDGAILIQDEASCTVWGMPRSVYEVGAFDHVGDIYNLGEVLNDFVGVIK
ncbi:MAG: chemotaxis-specific protein-glutamate methyltransferase CheB [Zetaproteobacteria bacterium]|nr:chemotaxis-specific protein-glutamate methyltransferase CheB [Zetaproteobacteria bacterium]